MLRLSSTGEQLAAACFISGIEEQTTFLPFTHILSVRGTTLWKCFPISKSLKASLYPPIIQLMTNRTSIRDQMSARRAADMPFQGGRGGAASRPGQSSRTRFGNAPDHELLPDKTVDGQIKKAARGGESIQLVWSMRMTSMGLIHL